MRHDDTSGYIQDTSRYMYLGCFVRVYAAVGDDDHKKPSRCPLQPPAKKQKGGKGAAQAPVPAVAPAKAPKAVIV